MLFGNTSEKSNLHHKKYIYLTESYMTHNTMENNYMFLAEKYQHHNPISFKLWI